MSFYQLKEPIEASKIESIEGNILVLEGGEEIKVSDHWIASNPCRPGNYYSPGGVIRGAAYFDTTYVEVIRPEDQAEVPDAPEGDSGD